MSAVPISSIVGPFPRTSSSNSNTGSSLCFNARCPSSAFSCPILTRKRDDSFVCGASNDVVLNGLAFQPFEEVKKDELAVPTVPNVSLARHLFADECEAAINEQINVEYTVSYVYHAAYAYFDRDNVALRGLAKFFKESSVEERGHAEGLMNYQNMRGGKVMLRSIQAPPMEFDHPEKGDALHAMELALSLEKLNYEKLMKLQSVAESNNDPQLMDFIDDYLEEQVESLKKFAEYVAQLRRVGKGHGVWHFDQMLLHNDEGAA